MAAAAALVVLGLFLTAERETGRLVLEPVSYRAIPGWEADDHAAALAALARSCAGAAERPATASLGGDPRLAARAGDLQAACAGIATVTAAGAREFIEARFEPFRIRNGRAETGLMTGYYEPEMTGSRTPGPDYTAPVLARPADLVSVDLGDFRDALRGQRIAGRVEAGRLVPYADRAAIAEGALDAGDLALVWLRDAVEAFFLEIQGSGRVVLADGPDAGEVIRLSYAGQNGHPYTAIGRVLIERGEIAREAMSMAAIRDWLRAHPDEARAVMNVNASYVFFTELPVEAPDLGPPGAEGVLLTPGRSLAVDRTHHILGVPMWLAMDAASPVSPDGPLARLMVAQDTGGAIRGPVRGDVFTGIGDAAGEIAGAMRHDGRLIVLLPAPLAERARAVEW